MGLLPCIQLLCEHPEREIPALVPCWSPCCHDLCICTALCIQYISVGSPGTCARNPSALQTTQPPDSSGQPRALGLAFPKTSPSVCCSAILETLTVIGNSGRDGAVFCFVGGAGGHFALSQDNPGLDPNTAALMCKGRWALPSNGVAMGWQPP